MKQLILASGLVSLACVGSAAAGSWKYGRPGAPYEPIPGMEKSGIPQLEGQWQYECKVAQAPANMQDTKQRYLSVYIVSPVWITTQCYYGRQPETPVVIHKSYYLDPNVPINYFRKDYGIVLKAEYPWVPAPTIGQLRLAIGPRTCMTIVNGDLGEGATVRTAPCNGAPNQRFKYSTSQRGQIVAMPGTNGARGYPMCLDYWPSSGTNNGEVKIWPCHQLYSTQPDTQVWWPVGGLQLRANNTGYCLGPSASGALATAGCTFNGPEPTAFDWGP